MSVINEYACIKHPVLGPDAWSMVINNYPRNEGLEAYLTCRVVCRAREKCPFSGGGTDIIAMGGWFGGQSRFTYHPEGWIAVIHAAAYIGLSANHVKSLIAKYRLASSSVQKKGLMRIEDMKMLTMRHGQHLHGTVKGYRLHFVRDEPPCTPCTKAYQGIQQEVEVLTPA